MRRSRIVVGVMMVALAAAYLTGCGSGQKSSGSSNVVASGEYAFWPPLPDEPRIQYLTSYRFSSDVEPEQGALDEIIFGAERTVLPITKPYGVDMWKGRIYVCDVTNPGVVILDLAARETRIMTTSGTDPMAQPIDIAIAPDGMKYVVDRRRSRIFVFSAEDRHVASFGESGMAPVGVAVRDRELLVPDFQSQTVVVLDRFSGERTGSIGAPGGDPGQFIRPLGIDTDDQGNVYVTDAIRGRLQKFDPSGQLVYAQGELADSAGNFVRPKHVVEHDGVVYVVDAAFQNVQMFTDDGELLMFFGSPGTHPGAMSLPAGVAVYHGDFDAFRQFVHPAFEPERLVLVTNQFGLNKVSVYALGGLKDGRTVADIAPYAAEVASGFAPDDVMQEDGAGADLTGSPPAESQEE